MCDFHSLFSPCVFFIGGCWESSLKRTYWNTWRRSPTETPTPSSSTEPPPPPPPPLWTRGWWRHQLVHSKKTKPECTFFTSSTFSTAVREERRLHRRPQNYGSTLCFFSVCFLFLRRRRSFGLSETTTRLRLCRFTFERKKHVRKQVGGEHFTSAPFLAKQKLKKTSSAISLLRNTWELKVKGGGNR